MNKIGLLILLVLTTALIAVGALAAQDDERPADVVCENGLKTRLILHERGRITDDDERPSRIRSGPGTNFDILTTVNNNEVFVVVNGPRCSDLYTWYEIRYRQHTGWIAEGEPGLYYVEPYLTG
jgi:hypothetical protein